MSIQAVVDGQALTGATSSWQYFKVTVPAGNTTLDVSTFGGSGDADLYVRYGALPTSANWDTRPYLNGNNEYARMTNIVAGEWYIGIYGYNGYSGLNLQATSY
ncbi:MAG: PPC domain-containing protein [Gammaproteobacteria bacterium]